LRTLSIDSRLSSWRKPLLTRVRNANPTGRCTSNRCYDQLITALPAPAERGNAPLGRWPGLDRVTVCPQRIGEIAAAALVLTSLDRGTS
jgi:hypothetical protein